MSVIEACAAELRDRCNRTAEFTEADLCFIRDRLGSALTPFTFIAVLREAFSLPVLLLRSVENWKGASTSGEMSTAEAVSLIANWLSANRSTPP